MMKNVLVNVVTALVVIALLVMSVLSGFRLDALQWETLKIVGIIAGGAALYCFVVGEISRNNSQMDKIWSILPIAYAWVITAKGGMQPRLIVMAVLITLWGIRLTANFARKGAYSVKFWSGEEDYRWPILRQHKILGNKFAWALFDLLFISVYQNALVLLICLPMLACMSSTLPFGVMDVVAATLVALCIVYETIADEQQMKFQTTKWKMIHEGKKLEELPEPYKKGFNTVGLWSVSRHPNYFAEQSTWICLYLFCIGAGVVQYGVFNWSMVGCLLLIFLFMGSSTFAEGVSGKKYPLYQDYQNKVFKYFPFKKYKE